MAVQSFRLLLLISSKLRIMISFCVMIQILSFSCYLGTCAICLVQVFSEGVLRTNVGMCAGETWTNYVASLLTSRDWFEC